MGLNAGFVFPDPLFTVNILANGQYTWPGTVYYGGALRLYLKIYDGTNSSNYTSIQVVGKDEWFNNVKFTDKIYGTDLFVDYTMNETAMVYGIEVLRGHEIDLGEPLHGDFFYGFGFRQRVMNYNVLTSDAYVGMPLGPGSYIKMYITPIIGYRLEF